MSLAESLTQLVESAVELPVRFAEVAAHDPVSAVLMALGALLTFVAVGVMGYLSLGAFVSLFTRDWSPASPPTGR